jgi:hypothetical protein
MQISTSSAPSVSQIAKLRTRVSADPSSIETAAELQLASGKHREGVSVSLSLRAVSWTSLDGR